MTALVVILAVAYIGLRSASIFREDKLTYIKDLTSRLNRTTAKSILSRINTIQDKLIIFTSYRESLSRTPVKLEDQSGVLFSQNQEFMAVGLLHTDDHGVATVAWTMRNTLNPVTSTWPADFEKNLMAKINLTEAKSGRGVWTASSLRGDNLLVFGLRVEIAAATPAVQKTWVLGVLPATAFDDLLTDFSTGVNKAYILDQTGTVLATSDITVKGVSVKNQPLFSDALQEAKTGEAQEYQIDGHLVMGSFETVEKTNLISIVVTPEDKAFDAAQSITRNVIFVGGVFVLLALGLTILFSNFFVTGPLKKISAAVHEMARGHFNVPLNIVNKDEFGELARSLKEIETGMSLKSQTLESAKGADLQSEKLNAYVQLSGGIVSEIKNPLAAVLGHIQLAMTKAIGDEAHSSLEIAEREIRRCKSVVENLARLAKIDKLAPQMVNIAQVAQDAINLVDHQLSLAGITIFKDFRPCPMVEIDGLHIQHIIISLLQNAGQAMETTAEKNVTIRVVEVSGRAQIQVEDTGIGIPYENQSRIFEPFYTTKPSGKGMGLSLSVGRGIVEECGGDLTFKSEKGHTVFTMELPLPQKRVMPEKPLNNSFGGKSAIVAPVLARPPLFENMVEKAPTADTNKDLPSEMPPIPEDEALFLEKIRPNTIPIPTAGIPTSLPKLKTHSEEPTPLTEAPTVVAEVPTTPFPNVEVEKVELRKIPDFKVEIRRPRIRT